MSAGPSYHAVCPARHPEATWRTVMVDVPGGSWEYLAPQVPKYVVDCPTCAAADLTTADDDAQVRQASAAGPVGRDGAVAPAADGPSGSLG